MKGKDAFLSRNDYVIRVLDSPGEVSARAWNQLLFAQAQATPFMRHEYLAALETSGSATPRTGWTPRFLTAVGRRGAGGRLPAVPENPFVRRIRI
jgi:predicted N-acyltransferase